MATLPAPKYALDNPCSVIYNNTLYVYEAQAFQSLPLVEGGEWAELPAGEAVTGGVCVGTTPTDPTQAALFVVGGTGTSQNYTGLQKYTYATGEWETITTSPLVTQDRLWHGATYLNSTSSILIYAGNQDGTQHPSSQTFTVQTSPPYAVTAFQSIAPPAVNPILMQWSETQVVMIGGGDGNTKVMLFGTDTSWQDSGSTLAAPLAKSVPDMQAILVTGDDGSKSIYTFDMTVSPNVVDRYVLWGANNAPVANSAMITTRDVITESQRRNRRIRKERRDLTQSNWPLYNATLAPQSTRTNYSLAQDSSGLVIFSGGNQDDVLSMFDARSNSWQNASAILGSQKVLTVSAPTSSILATASLPSASPGGSQTEAGTNSGSNMLTPSAVLGIVLGGIIGLAVFLCLILFLIRRRQRQQTYLEAGHQRRASGAPSDEKDNFAFANDSLSRGPGGHFRKHQPSDSQGSYSSVAILMGRVGQQKPGLKRKTSNDSRRTSTSSLFNKQFKSTISKPIPQLAEHPALQTAPVDRLPVQIPEEKGVSFAANVNEPRPQQRGTTVERQRSTRRSSGWNRYWSGGSTLNILGLGASKRTTVDSDQSSRYSTDNRMTQDSATVPQLHLDGPGRFDRVNSGSPTVSQYSSKIPLREGIAGKIEMGTERPVSPASMSGYSSGIPASVHDTWDPTETKKPWGADRAPTNAYNGSAYPTTLAPSSTARMAAPTGVSKQPQLAMASTSSDMSWLNLGEFGLTNKK